MSSRHFNQAAATRAFLLASMMYLSLNPAMAAEPAAPKEVEFSQFDTNHDGYIDSKEAANMPELVALLKAGDKNKDGKLSEPEFYAALKG